MSEWATQLADALSLWASGKPDQAGRGLQRTAASLTAPEQSLWKALTLNQLALVSSQLGHWDYAQTQWKSAATAWEACRQTPGSSGLDASLEWFSTLLRAHNFTTEAERLMARHRAGEPPLLDPWDASVQASLASSPAAARAAETVETPAWDALLETALLRAQEGRSDAVARACDAARQQAVQVRAQDGGQLLALVYGLEAVAWFQVGDYGQASQARAEAQRCWAECPQPRFGGELHARYGALLERAREAELARRFRERDGRRECPLLDPWADLQTGMAVSQAPVVAPFQLHKDYQPRLAESFSAWARGEHDRALQDLAALGRRMSAEEQAGPAGILLLQLQALFEFTAGHYDAAHSSYARARTAWEDLPPGKRREGPFLEKVKSLLTLHGYASMADRLGEEIGDPSVYHKPELQLARGDFEGVAAAEPSDPREAWEQSLREAWEAAGQKRWNVAQRRAVNAERAARLLGFEDLRVTYALNSQALFAQSSGDYADAESLFNDTTLQWRRGAHTVGARPAWNEFCCLLRDSGWLELASQLEAAWPEGEQRSAFDPALLPLTCMDQVGMRSLESAAVEAPADPGKLQLPPEFRQPAPPPVSVSRPRSGPPWGLLLLLLALAAGAGWWWTHRPH